MKKTLGVLAHVDAGKTTFSESVLYMTGVIRKKGRVDHQDTFLDSDPMEMLRGITIFSGLASFSFEGQEIDWLDTPGHADFSSEMERSLSVMDDAILIVSAADGVQSHTETVWHMLADRACPTFLFLNKCDRTDVDPDAVIRQMRKRLSPDILDLRRFQQNGRILDDAELTEAIAGYDEALMDAYFAGETDEARWQQVLTRLIQSRTVFPVMAGSALTGDGVEGFLRFVLQFSPTSYDPKGQLQALCFRVRHESDGQRLCFLKLLRGTLTVRDTLPLPESETGGVKISEIRLYSGQKYRRVSQAEAGDIIAVPVAQGLQVGDAVGEDTVRLSMQSRAMTSAAVLYDASVPPYRMAEIMRMMEDEDPSLGVQVENGDISVRVLGPMQLEILSQQLMDRFGLSVRFGPPRILYHETIADTVIGIGHYEPLRHYAEVHLRLSPGPRGSGITFRSFAHVDDLALNWQRLIETHVFEKAHKGVLTGSPLTDVQIDLLCGRDHLKHTEGGDFRQATYRAIRQGLMQAASVLLEPVCAFRIRVPREQYGAMTAQLTRLQALCDPPEYSADTVELQGTCVYARFLAFQQSFAMQTHGLGTLQVALDHEEPCHNPDEVIAAFAYNPLADDPPDSVFCSHGAGFTVAWDHVRDFAHLADPDPATLTRETVLHEGKA